MSGTAFALVVGAAVAHAVWNLYAKRAGSAGAVFAWLYAGTGALLYAPLAVLVVVLTDARLAAPQLAFMGGSVVLHTVYVVLLQRGYAAGDLSVVYPVARGLGPLLAVAGAIALLGERPRAVSLAGALAVCIGVAVLGLSARGPAPVGGASRALGYAGATGVAIACYTLWDAYAVAVLAIPPLLFDWVNNVGRWALLTPHAWRRRDAVARVWRLHRTEVLVVGALFPLAYILVLVAYTLAPVTHVAPARELSIVIGTVLGARVLAEGATAPRVAAALTVLAGVVVLGVA
jgi:drug/metabolite transporter (DMT)-like permease